MTIAAFVAAASQAQRSGPGPRLRHRIAPPARRHRHGDWNVPDFDAALAHLTSVGARRYRGPMRIGDDHAMCQLRDPWDNCIGIRGSTRAEET